MADLIIKPNSATGDKLILQDRAGGAVITTADSGAAMASNVTGIPAAGVTGVLPVGVTGGSGLTTLASNPTVTLGSNATFPAGHVLQIQSSSKLDAFTTASVAYVNITGTDQNASGSVWCVKITPSATSSKILVHASILWSYGTQGNTASYARLMRDSTPIGVNSSLGSSGSGSFCMDGQSNHYYYNRRDSHQYLDSPSSTSELTYKVQIGEIYNGNVYNPAVSVLSLNTSGYGTSGADNTQVMKGISTITVTEIQG